MNNSQKITLLCFEKNDADFEKICAFLHEIRPQEYSIKRSTSCLRGLDILKKETHDVCFITQAKDNKGLKLLRRATNQNLHGPFILLTENQDYKLDIEAMRSGAAGFLVKKQLDPFLLERTIRYAVNNKKIGEKLLITDDERTKEIELAQERLKFLSDAGKILFSSLDHQSMLKNITKKIVPHLADWCGIDMLIGDGKIKSITVEHTDPAKVELAKSLQEKYPPNFDSKRGIIHVIKTGKAMLLKEISNSDLETIARDKIHLKILKSIGMKSAMIIPLKTNTVIFGAISFISSGSERRFGKDDFLFAKDLAQRISVALDNVKLYEKSLEGIRVRDEFLNIASHELKTPLTSLHLQIQLLTRQIIESSENKKNILLTHDLLQASTKQIKRLGKLVNDLLDVSRMNNKKFDAEIEFVKLSNVVAEVIKRFEDEAKLAGSEIIVKNNDEVTGEWDRFRIDQVITNLLSNAIKYGNGKPIEIATIRKDDRVKLLIRDHGIGIEQKDLTRIFDKFERTDAAKRYGGLGLGLYIALQIIKAHNGKIHVKSRAHFGSLFVVELPLRRQYEQSAVQSFSHAQ